MRTRVFELHRKEIRVIRSGYDDTNYYRRMIKFQ